ncbi:MAG TPA: hydantoinase B/oxoprolinase family protein [Acidobacteriaceae bacterium]|nr:hydantoinase B/oxoprolinase family protein [Acidobacteriaceae bacterium]
MSAPVDPIELAVFQNAMTSIAEEMGAALRRSAVSPNIKERRDYSCAIFDGKARVVAMGDHMPVHLGSMPMSVLAAVSALELNQGDIGILNDPYAGGTHLPDITMVMPVFANTHQPIFYVAARAHHSDVGGMFAGSMGPAREIFQEGIRIPPVHILRAGEMQKDVLQLILHNVRTPIEREGDLTAQTGACRIGEERLLHLGARYSAPHLAQLCEDLLDHSERLVRAELRLMPAGEYFAEDLLDDDGISADPVRIAVALRLNPDAGALELDFAGSSPQVHGSINAVRAITLSACLYVLRCLLPDGSPTTAGTLRPLTLKTLTGTVVDAQSPAAVAGGNVETSQRIVDTILRAFAQAAPARIPAASAGTMSNLTIGGIDPRKNLPFTYYETIAGGMGAGPFHDGTSGVHTHMTNSLNTPIESLEFEYPLRVKQYSYRRESGGNGKWNGGDGLIREFQLLADSQLTLLSDRQKFAPYGLSGGSSGAHGNATAIMPEESTQTQLQSKSSQHLPRGTTVRIETPGGGGWGSPKR